MSDRLQQLCLGGQMADWKVVLVDDDPDRFGVAEQILRHFGASVRTARSAAQALEILDSFQPTHIVVDLSLPGRDAWNLLNQVRARSEWAEVAVVALASHTMRSEAATASASGFDGCLLRPVVMTTFVDELREAVERRSRKH